MDNKKVSDAKTLAGEFYSFTDKGQMIVNTNNVSFETQLEDVLADLSKHIKNRASVKLQDFENHLDAVTNDWRNTSLSNK